MHLNGMLCNAMLVVTLTGNVPVSCFSLLLVQSVMSVMQDVPGNRALLHCLVTLYVAPCLNNTAARVLRRTAIL